VTALGSRARGLLLPGLVKHVAAVSAATDTDSAASQAASARALGTVVRSSLPQGSVTDTYSAPVHDVAASPAWGRLVVAGRCGLRTGPAGGSGLPSEAAASLGVVDAPMPPEAVCHFLPDDGGLTACFSAAPIGDSRFAAIAEATRVTLRSVDAPTRALELTLPALGVPADEHHLLVRRVRSSPLGVCVAAVTTVGFVVLWQLPPFCHVAAPGVAAHAGSFSSGHHSPGSPALSPRAVTPANTQRYSPPRSPAGKRPPSPPPPSGATPATPAGVSHRAAAAWRATDPGQPLEPALSVKVFAETLDACFARDGTAPLKLAVLGAASVARSPVDLAPTPCDVPLALATVDCVTGHVAWTGDVECDRAGSRLSRLEVVADASARMATRAVVSVAGGAAITELFAAEPSRRGVAVAVLVCPERAHGKVVPDCLGAATLHGREGTVAAAGWSDGSVTVWAATGAQPWAPFARFSSVTLLGASPRASPLLATPAMPAMIPKQGAPGVAAIAVRPGVHGFTLVAGFAAGAVVNVPVLSLSTV